MRVRLRHQCDADARLHRAHDAVELVEFETLVHGDAIAAQELVDEPGRRTTSGRSG